jgi:polysaccharide export outer membrane protein
MRPTCFHKWASPASALAQLRLSTFIGAFAALTFCFAISARAQDTQGKKPDATSDLARENLSEVAASSMQIKTILLEDPGLMVMLKDWIAQDSTDHGQVVSADDLTDAAVYDRLEVDIPFRAVATRLVQQYGFLIPQVNPESQMGQQQLLLMQERAKLVAQQEQMEVAQQHPANLATASSNMSGGGATAACPQAPVLCASQAQAAGALPSSVSPILSGTGTSNPAQQTAPPPTPASGPSLERAQYIQTGSASGGDLAMLGLMTGSPAANASGPNDSLSLAQGLNSSTANPGGSDPLLATTLGSLPTGGTPTSGFESVSPTHPEASPVVSSRGYEAGAEAISAAGPTLVRASDPYTDIPSLYDMYLQAIPRPAEPTRFGSEVFLNGIRDPQSIPMDLPVGPDYVVGPGDGLAFDLWGGVSQRLYGTVDREGRVSLPEVGPILVSGKSLADVQETVQQVLRTQFRDVSVDVSLSRLRTIRVYEVGEVTRPGAYDISSLSTPLNALFAAGGPTSQGSMRIVKHYRGAQLVEEVDLYDLLLHGVKNGMERLENGDTILVPPPGPQVSVEGMVRRPAIYELKDEKTLADALELAGGMLPAATMRHIEVQRLVAHDKQTMLSLDIPETDENSAAIQKLESFQIQDGDRIRIYPIAPYNQDAVYLEGHVLRPGRYSYRANMRIGNLIASYQELLPEPSTQYAEIIRLNAPDFHPTVQSFDLGAAMENPAMSPQLQPMDTVRIFGRYDFENTPSVTVSGDVRTPGTYQTPGQIRLADAVHLAGGISPSAQTQDAQVFRSLPNGESKVFSVKLGLALDGDPTENIQLQSRDRVLIHGNPDAQQPATVYIEGAVGRPGRYPLMTNMTVADLIKVGGGLKASADTKAAELTTYEFTDAKTGQTQLSAQHQEIAIAAALAGEKSADLPLRNGDVVTIREVPGWSDLGASITVKGEVVHPGTYGIRPGERLSSVIERAGGFQHDAYVYGAVLERVEVRELENKQQDELVGRLKSEGAALQNLPDTTDQQKQSKYVTLQQYQTVLTELSASSPVGRVAIRISAPMRAWKNSASDIQVRGGDVLVIPKRPDFVMVIGQVFNPTAVSYRPGKSAKWYLTQSGGPTNLANKKEIFVMRADGSVIGSKSGLLSGDPLDASLAPGDTIVVPEKAVSGGIPWTNLFTTAQIASSMFSAVFIALHY